MLILDRHITYECFSLWNANTRSQMLNDLLLKPIPFFVPEMIRFKISHHKINYVNCKVMGGGASLKKEENIRLLIVQY